MNQNATGYPGQVFDCRRCGIDCITFRASVAVCRMTVSSHVFGSAAPPPIFCCFVVFREKRKKKKIVTTTAVDVDVDVDVGVGSSSFAIFPLGYILFSATTIDQSNLCCPPLSLSSLSLLSLSPLSFHRKFLSSETCLDLFPILAAALLFVLLRAKFFFARGQF